MTWRMLTRLAEVVAGRILPGLLNLGAITLVSAELLTEDYGQFSITLATVTLAGSLLFGPILHAIVPLHARYVAEGSQHRLERGLLGLTLMLALIVLIPGALAALAGWTGWPELALLLGYSLFSTWQPVLRARLQFWRYGASALVQGGLLVGILVALDMSGDPLGTTLRAYAASYLAGFLIAWLLTGAPLPGLLSAATIRSIFGLGGSLTISALAESVLLLGFRYVILWFGSAQFLGRFSFAVDLAQRSVGVVVNIVSFAVVPRAYKLNAQGAHQRFYHLLWQAALLAGTGAALMLVLLLILRPLDLLPGINAQTLPLGSFCAASAAFVINRIKKMVMDPFLISVGAPLAIPLGYVIVGIPSLLLAVGLISLGSEQGLLILYPSAYALVALFAWLSLKKRRKEAP